MNPKLLGVLNMPRSPRRSIYEQALQLCIGSSGAISRSAGSLAAPGQTPMQALHSVDLDEGRWVNYWPPGTTRVVIANIPPGVTDSLLKNLLEDAIQPLYPFREREAFILNIKRVIGEYAPTQKLSTVGIALVECINEEAALCLWSAAEYSPPIFGRRLNVSPDPSGFRAFGHAVALNARPTDFDNLAEVCNCCKGEPDQGGEPGEPGGPGGPGGADEPGGPGGASSPSKVILPFMTPATLAEKLNVKHISKVANVEWIEETGCAVLTFKSSQVRKRFCLPVRYSFPEDPPLRVGWFTTGGGIAAAIIDPARNVV